MSQEEIYQLLKKHENKWFTIKELTNEIGKRASSIGRSVGKLKTERLIELVAGKNGVYPIKIRYNSNNGKE